MIRPLHCHAAPLRRPAAGLVIAAGFALAATVTTGCASGGQDAPTARIAAQSTERPKVPDEIAVDGEPLGISHAKGVQVYTWRVQGGKGEWTPRAPEATLTGEAGFAGTQTAGPAWMSEDGSGVRAVPMRSAPAPDAGALPWQLLKAREVLGRGAMTSVSYIQRINTAGGAPPANPGTRDGEEARVPFTADYVFYGAGANVNENK